MQTSFAKFFFKPSCDSLADDLSRGVYASWMTFNDSQRLILHKTASWTTVCRCNAGYENKSVNDRFTKFNLYQRAGVREYWIVDPDSKCVQVFALTDGYYTAADFGEAGDELRVNVLDDCAIDLSQVFSE